MPPPTTTKKPWRKQKIPTGVRSREKSNPTEKLWKDIETGRHKPKQPGYKHTNLATRYIQIGNRPIQLLTSNANEGAGGEDPSQSAAERDSPSESLEDDGRGKKTLEVREGDGARG